MTEQNSGRQIVVFQILHALVWAFGILLASYLFSGKPWSNEIAPWMALAYVIVNGLILQSYFRRARADD